MRRTVLSVAGLVVGMAVGLLAAQDKDKTTMTVNGVVAKIGGNSLTLNTSKGDLELTTTSDTKVEVAAGGSKARSAREAGQAGLKISDAVHVGDQVSVKYADVGGKKIVSAIDVKERRPLSAQPVK